MLSDNYELNKDLICFNEVCLGQVIDNVGQRSPRLFPELNHKTNENILTIRGQIVDNAGQRYLLLGSVSIHNVQIAEEFADQNEYVNPGNMARGHLQSYHPQVARPNNKEGYKTIIQEGESVGSNWDITMNRLLMDQEERIRRLEEGISTT